MVDTTYAIIGGGIVGATVAYHLSQRTDDPVAVYERGMPASGTTFKSMAMYGLYGDETQYRMKRYGLRLYNEFFAAPRARPRYNLGGRLEVATTETGADEMAAALEDGSGPKSISGVDRDLLEYIPGDELDEVLLLPRLNTDAIAGAVHRPRVGFMQPQELAFEFVERAKDNGVGFETGVRVTDVTTAGGRVTGLVTDDGEVAADEVICAAGPWNLEIARRAGVEVPVRHTLAPILKFRTNERAEYSLPAIGHHESPYAIYRQESRDRGAMYVGYNPSEEVEDVREFLETFEEYDPDATDESVPEEVRGGAMEAVERLLPSLLDADLVDEWVGIRSVTPDGNPVVGWTDLEGFSIAAFHTSGIQLAPKVGDVIAGQLVDGDPSDLYDALSISRFEGYTDVHDGEP